VFWSLEDKLAFRRHFPAISWLNSYSLYREALAESMGRLATPEVGDESSRAMMLLEKESELEEIVRLVGKDTLSARDRLVLEVARSIREDFLHQNAFHDIDTYASLAKQARMLSAILRFYELAQQALGRGADIGKIEQLSAREKVARLKYLEERESETAVTGVLTQIERELAALDRGTAAASPGSPLAGEEGR
jgi:V/A-type H+-transporting ATPase subunit A